MIMALHLGLLVALLAAGPQSDAGPYIHIDRLSPRVALAYWPGIDRRCNLTVIQSRKVLVTGAIAYQQYRVPEIGEESHLEDVHRFIAVLDGLLADGVKIDHVIPGHSVPLTGAVLPPIRDYYQRMLQEVAAARQQGLTLDEATRRLTLRAKFPAFRDPPPGTYGYDHQERSVRNLWRILAEEQPAPQPETAKP